MERLKDIIADAGYMLMYIFMALLVLHALYGVFIA